MGSTDPALLHLLGDGYLRTGQVHRAVQAYRALLALVPDDRRAQERMGVLTALSDLTAATVHLRAASTPLADTVLRALEEPGPGPAARLWAIGRACLGAGDPVLAVPALERAVVYDPSFAEAHALLGHALAQRGTAPEEDQRAREHLETAVRLRPDSPLTRSLLGLYLLERGDPLHARPHLEAAYDLDPTNPATALYLGRMYANLGNYLAADVWFAEATRLAPKDPRIWEIVVRFYADPIPAGPPGRSRGPDPGPNWRRTARRPMTCWAGLSSRWGTSPKRKRRSKRPLAWTRTWPPHTITWAFSMPPRACESGPWTLSAGPWISTPTRGCARR